MATQKDIDWFHNNFRPHFITWVQEPARKMAYASPQGFGMPAFVWLACAVDWLSGFMWGDSTVGHVKKAYTTFIDSYFPPGQYDAEELFDSLRNGLVHMYTIKDKKYVLTDGKPHLHLTLQSNGQIILNLESFYEDWVEAKERYFDAVEADPSLLDKLLLRLRRDGFLDLVRLQLGPSPGSVTGV
jgi:hypothetical protein